MSRFSLKNFKLAKKVLEKGLLAILDLLKKPHIAPLKTHQPRAIVLLLSVFDLYKELLDSNQKLLDYHRELNRARQSLTEENAA